VFRDSRRKCPVLPLHPPMAEIECIMILKVLGVTITNTLSTSDHIREVISCAQTQHASRILHAHSFSDSELNTIFRSVTLAKIMYASIAWSRFATNATSNESTCSWGITRNVDFVSQTYRHFINFVTLMTSSCSAKFYTTSIRAYLLPPPSAASQSYNFWNRRHRQLLLQYLGHVMDSNFIICMLYKNIYWSYPMNTLTSFALLYPVCVLSGCWLNEYVMLCVQSIHLLQCSIFFATRFTSDSQKTHHAFAFSEYQE